MGRTRNQIIDSVTDNYIANVLSNPVIPSPEQISIDLINEIETEILLENAIRPKGQKLRTLETLAFDQIATLMAKIYPIARISCAGTSADPEYDLLTIYMEDGPDKGIYTVNEEELYKIAIRFNRRMSWKEFEEIERRLRVLVPRMTRCMDPDLIAVNNGIFNYKTKTLSPFSRDIVFMVKSHIDYNPNAKNISIYNHADNTYWDVESWIAELSDDPEVVNLIWEILGAIIRPHVRWNKSAWFFSEQGNNGKGTLCELMRQLCGDTAYASIPLNDFGKDFALEPLTRSTAIIVDENDVGTFVDKAANLKAIITNDVISINRKFKIPISYQFYGFMVQCLNEFPRIRDKSDSFYRRQLFVPFDKCFTGHERKYIKEDYLHRKEILEYVLYRVLNMNYYTLSEPESCKNVLTEYKSFNDPVRQFFEEFENEFKWDLLPFSFLYELYTAWFHKNSPSGSIQGKNKFISEIINVSSGSTKWCCLDKSKNIRSTGKMAQPEPLIGVYDLTSWMNPSCKKGGNSDKLYIPDASDFYRGLVRISSAGNNTTDPNSDTD